VIVIFKLELDSVNVNRHANYLGYRTCNSKITVWTVDTDRHTRPISY